MAETQALCQPIFHINLEGRLEMIRYNLGFCLFTVFALFASCGQIDRVTGKQTNDASPAPHAHADCSIPQDLDLSQEADVSQVQKSLGEKDCAAAADLLQMKRKLYVDAAQVARTREGAICPQFSGSLKKVDDAILSVFKAELLRSKDKAESQSTSDTYKIEFDKVNREMAVSCSPSNDKPKKHWL